MNRRDANPARWIPPAVWIAVAVAVAALWLGWRVVAATMAATYALADPAVALAWDAAFPDALVRLAERQLRLGEEATDLTAVSDLAGRALVASPLEARALRLMALAADLGADGERAERLMTVAGARSLRDPAAQAWLFQNRLRSGDVAAALDHADALLRTEPQLADRMLPALAGLASDPAAWPALVARLATDPPWRPRLLAELGARGEPAAAFAVLSELRSGPNPPTDGEVTAYLDRLIAEERFELAYLAWIHFLAPERTSELAYVTNGDFERPITGGPFDWRIDRATGASTSVVATGDPDRGLALRVVFADTRVPYRNLTKLLLLPPGGYRLLADVKANDLNTARGMTWRVRCAGGERRIVGETPPVAGTTAWQRVEGAFEVPSTGCRAQWLSLELAARAAVERQVSGEIWFDRVKIARLRGVSAASAE